MNAGLAVDFVSPKGGKAPLDGVNRDDADNARFLDDQADRVWTAVVSAHDMHDLDRAAQLRGSQVRGFGRVAARKAALLRRLFRLARHRERRRLLVELRAMLGRELVLVLLLGHRQIRCNTR